MFTLSGYVSSLLTLVATVLGIVLMGVVTLLAAPVGVLACLIYLARSLFDETSFRQLQAHGSSPI